MRKIVETRDLKLIHAADRVCFPYDPECGYMGSAKWWLMKVDGVTAGYIGAVYNMSGGHVYNCRTGVLPWYRGQGIQKLLTKHVIKWAKSIQASAVVTDTVVENVASNNSLIACGFKTYSPEFPWNVPGGIYWRREIKF